MRNRFSAARLRARAKPPAERRQAASTARLLAPGLLSLVQKVNNRPEVRAIVARALDVARRR